eukprot:EG_transcript_21452
MSPHLSPCAVLCGLALHRNVSVFDRLPTCVTYPCDRHLYRLRSRCAAKGFSFHAASFYPRTSPAIFPFVKLLGWSNGRPFCCIFSTVHPLRTRISLEPSPPGSDD